MFDSKLEKKKSPHKLLQGKQEGDGIIHNMNTEMKKWWKLNFFQFIKISNSL